MNVHLSIHTFNTSGTGVLHFNRAKALRDALEHMQLIEKHFPGQNEFGITADHEALIEYIQGLDGALEL